MSKVLYVDCFAGAAGDMMLGALLDLGLPEAYLRERLATLGELGYSLGVRRTLRHGISAVDVGVHVGAPSSGWVIMDAGAANPLAHNHGHGHSHGAEHGHSHGAELGHSHGAELGHSHGAEHGHGHSHGAEHGHGHSHGAGHGHGAVGPLSAPAVAPPGPGVVAFVAAPPASPQVPHRPWRTIRALIQRAPLYDDERALALRIFERLAAAEARLHGMSAEDVEFHEVGGVDAIVDIVGTAIGLAWLRPQAVVVAPIPTPRGFVRCAHGLMPLPAPATLELLRGATTQHCRFEGEWVTPTGAAILTAVATAYGPMPAMQVEAIGYGAGDRDPETHPNLLRLVVGHAESAHGADVVIETNIDDMSPELYGHLAEQLFEAGALDVWLTPIQMKKGRPATMLSVLSPSERRATLEHLILVESTAIGVRSHEVVRHKASRTLEPVDTPLGVVRIKVARDGDQIVSRAPEYDDCRALARASGTPLKDVMAMAVEAAHLRFPTGRLREL